jgi:hypothetical protein
MVALRNYKLPDGTTRQYREGEQPECAVAVATAAPVQTPEARMAEVVEKAHTTTSSKRRSSRKSQPKEVVE